MTTYPEPVIDASAPGDSTAERILDAAQRCFEEVGIRRTSMDDIARAAGVGRVTVFRIFDTKDQLVQMVLIRIVEAMTSAVRAAFVAGTSLEKGLTDALVTSVLELRGQALFIKVLRTEPDAFLRTIATDGASVIVLIRTSVVDWLGESGGGPLTDVDAAMAAEWITRVGISLVLTPEGLIPIDDDAGLRTYVERYLVPGIALLAKTRG